MAIFLGVLLDTNDDGPTPTTVSGQMVDIYALEISPGSVAIQNGKIGDITKLP
jgi:hypothetical protein